MAFARANFNNGILTQHEFEENERGLLEVEKEWEAGNFKIAQGDEGRLRLWLRDELRKREGHLISFLRVTAHRAEKGIDSIMPGYTHLQRP
ncbi:hypothetical protein COL154_008427 [Colletotrichum chrysophilum]|uniref:uncharacterized protein n=1 Tax=Colletotrichum chrysophilum TaxID=1836956 RepID=UPI002301F43D|nr:uncharacterized protein COL26b_007048 [Colletotrichum chrysophilum]KAJ0346261.1 hypothetical protein KNSL1_007614 [Colletotrichum chrysophilum]KAJ0359281.1 hypothetical protein COL154_008427 [Colletotrichum chrysophilum]KAJ0374727.1 hypothetical protein COL26b_007048 [Colletotrichum chrysophilum]